MIKLISLIIAGALTLTGCSSDGSTSNTEDTQVKVEKQEEPKEPAINKNNMTVETEDFIMEINSVEVVKDYDGNDTLEITYTYTNNTEETTSALMEILFKGFQNGKQMDNMAYIENRDYNEQIDVRPGITQEECTAYFTLSDNSEVELEVSSLFGDEPALFKINIEEGTIVREK